MTKLLDAYLQAIEEKKEAQRLRLLSKTRAALDTLCGQLPFTRAYIFGSVLKKKRFYYDSDIDIAVEGLKDEDFFRFMARASDLIGREVDVVGLEKHRLREKIMREGLLWKKRA